jgi:hypothetical protein
MTQSMHAMCTAVQGRHLDINAVSGSGLALPHVDMTPAQALALKQKNRQPASTEVAILLLKSQIRRNALPSHRGESA